MKNQHLIEIINNYILTPHTDYALMINGKWGSGKTYFVKNNLMNLLSDNNPIYISLNGLTDIKSIATKLLISYYRKSENINLGLDVIQTILEFADESKYFKLLSKTKNFIVRYVENRKLKNLGFSNAVIFFDDLERISSKLEIEDVLGYINNNFIEHNNVKVVLICDENVIEHKYKEYLNIKEKLINRSINFTLDVDDFLPDYFSKRYSKHNNKYYNLLASQSEMIILILKNVNEVNIRTFNFIFDTLLNVFGLMDSRFEVNFVSILQFSIMVSIEYKNGLLKSSEFENYKGLDNFEENISALRFEGYSLWKKQQNKEERKPKYFEEFYEKYIKNTNIKLVFNKTIYQYILTGYLSKEELNIELTKIFKKIRECDIAIEKLYKYYNLEEDELIELIKSIINYLENGEYHLRIYPSIYFHMYNIYNEKIIKIDFDMFKHTFNASIEKLKNQPDKIPNPWDFVQYNSTISEVMQNDEMRDIINKIKAISDENENRLLDDKYKYFIQSLHEFEWNKFISAYGEIDHAKLFEKIYKLKLYKNIILLKNAGINKLFVILNDLYLGERKMGLGYSSEKEYLIKVANKLKEESENIEFDSMKKYYLNKLISDLIISAQNIS